MFIKKIHARFICYTQTIMDTHNELHSESFASRLNWLRAGVLGANDGIVSMAALLVGVAGADTSTHTLFLTGTAGLIAGALSMAVGEYVSVSSQRDSEKALLDKERFELKHEAEKELEELVHIYQKKGLKRDTAHQVAIELTAHDAFAAHVEAELGIDPNDLTNPLHAAVASAVAFTIGGLIPLLAIIIPSELLRVPITFGAVLIALIGTGILSAKLSETSKRKVVMRIVLGGIFAMAVTFGIGRLLGVAGM